MEKIFIVTDSTADIPQNIVKEKNIIVVPLTITFEGKTYKDKVDITQNQLIEMLNLSGELPKTSQINPQSFYEVYSKIFEEEPNAHIISIHISSKVSGTYQSALIAKDMLQTEKIDIIDSRSLSFGIGLLVLEGIKMIEMKMKVEEIVKKLNNLSEKVRVVFAVNTLEYLKKGGRISSVHATVGTLLNIKPILCMDDGKIEVFDKVRGSKKVLTRMLDYLKQEGIDTSLEFGIGNITDENGMLHLRQCIEEEFGIKDMHIADVGSVIATYGGPGTLGVFFFCK